MSEQPAADLTGRPTEPRALPDLVALQRRALARAAEYPESFYGLLARARRDDPRAGLVAPAQCTTPTLAPLVAHPLGRQVLALAQVGETTRAGQLLATLDATEDRSLALAALAVVEQTGPARLSLQMGEQLAGAAPIEARAARYPTPTHRPRDGYTVDPTLLWAIIRTESRFNPSARNSRSGAAGLVQMLPSTAAYLDPGVDYRGADAGRLLDPAHSLWLGNRYLDYLAASSLVEDDVVRLLVAYNAGPGTLQRILRHLDPDDDPLLFIEAIPLSETRAYVERVMADRWLYRLKQGLETPSLYALLDGHPARLPPPPQGADAGDG